MEYIFFLNSDEQFIRPAVRFQVKLALIMTFELILYYILIKIQMKVDN